LAPKIKVKLKQIKARRTIRFARGACAARAIALWISQFNGVAWNWDLYNLFWCP